MATFVPGPWLRAGGSFPLPQAKSKERLLPPGSTGGVSSHSRENRSPETPSRVLRARLLRPLLLRLDSRRFTTAGWLNPCGMFPTVRLARASYPSLRSAGPYRPASILLFGRDANRRLFMSLDHLGLPNPPRSLSKFPERRRGRPVCSPG
jgi:hypothetical protein